MSEPQHMQALAFANKIRIARANLRHRVLDGETPAADVILTTPREAESMTVLELLMSQHRWGSQRSHKVLRSASITDAKTLGSLTLRQRTWLVELLHAEEERLDISRALRRRRFAA